MEEKAGEWGRVEEGGRAGAVRVREALAVLLREAQQALACVRNAGIVNLMNAECRACRNNVRSAALR